jgi:hypothetical protein
MPRVRVRVRVRARARVRVRARVRIGFRVRVRVGVRVRVRALVHTSRRWSPPLVCATASKVSKHASDLNMARVPG